MSTKYKIIKAFNNNVLYCLDKGKECILVGKGIGFGCKEGEYIEENYKIEKVFYLVNENNKERFDGLLKEVDKEIIGVTEEIITMVSKEINKELDEKIHISLLDHIAFSFERYKNRIDIKNPFLSEIKSLYKDEYRAAYSALLLINERLNITLPIDEVGFIAMHIHAAVNRIDVSRTELNTTIINEIIGLLEEKIHREIDKESIEYVRLITHIRFALNRAEKKIPIKNILLSSIKRKFKESFSICKEIAKEIEKEYKISLTDDEIGYLAMHLQSILNG